MDSHGLKKTYIHAPPIPPPLSRLQRAKRVLAGIILSPTYWLLAYQHRVPGLNFHRSAALLALHLLFSQKARVPYNLIYHLLFWPMDSTRYFEFDFMWKALKLAQAGSYLDVSSPRLFPITLLMQKSLSADLINPDRRDLDVTALLIKALGLADHCRLHDCLIEATPLEAESFDVITSISVIEHIPRDTQAVQKMWDLLKPGGRLLLSVPCAAEASAQYINYNQYGILEPDNEGFVFWQRLYDPQLLQKEIFGVTGLPHRYAIYGENKSGFISKNSEHKRASREYPLWREPYMMGQ